MHNNSVAENDGGFTFVVHKQYDTIPVSPSKKRSHSTHSRRSCASSLERKQTRSAGDLPSSSQMGPLQKWFEGATRWTGENSDVGISSPPLTPPRRSVSIKASSMRHLPQGPLVGGSSMSNSVSSMDSEESFREASLKEKCKQLKIVF